METIETKRKCKFIINVVYYLILVILFVVIAKYSLGLLSPFVIAFVVASILRKPARYVSRRFHLPYRPLSLLFVLLFYGIMGVLIATLALRAFAEVCAIIETVPQIYNTHIVPVLNNLFLKVEQLVYRMDESLVTMIQGMDAQIIQWLGRGISSLSSWVVGMTSSVATAIPGLFIKLVLMVIATSFIAMDYETLFSFCARQLNEQSKKLFLQIKSYLVGTLFVCIGSYFIIMTMTFIELSIGFSFFIGLSSPLLIAGLIAIFDILPVLGTGGIMIPWAVFTLVSGDISNGIKLLLIYVAVTVVRNIVEPKIVGRQLGLHPVVTLASMFAGVQLFGVVGLFGFPIGLSLLRYLNDNGTVHILKTGTEKKG